jgi:adenylate cyclase
MAKLIITNESNKQTSEFAITKSEVRIGRHPTKNELVLPTKQVSAIHALLKRIGNEYLLIDLNSTNGTLVKNERIAEASLKDGDSFSIGTFTIEINDRSARKNDISYQESPIGQNVLTRSVSGDPYQTRMLDKDFEQGALEARLAEKIKILETLYELGRVFSSVFNIDQIFQQIADILFRLTPADRCAILVCQTTTNTLEPRLIKINPSKNLSSPQQIDFAISRTIASKVIADRLSLLSVDAQTDRRLSSESIAIQHIHSVMCAPLIGKTDVLGVIYVDKIDLRDSFSSDDLDLLNAVAGQAAIAFDNARAYEQLAQEAIARSSYQRFMPNHIIDLILKSPEGLKIGGTIQPATILFADIRGFTSMAEKSSPQLVVKALNLFFSAMTEIIFANLGTLDKYLGDGLMAIFGAPYPNDNDAINAVNAAIGMQRRLNKLNLEIKRLGFDPIEIGIGINTGDVTVGCIGSDRRMDYTAVGNTVNLASKLMSQAKGQNILISQTTFQMLGNVFRAKPLPDNELRGLSSYTRVYQIIYK